MLQEMLCTVCLLRCCWADKKTSVAGKTCNGKRWWWSFFSFFVKHLLTPVDLLDCLLQVGKCQAVRRRNSGHTLFRHLHCCWVQCTADGVNIWVSISDICLFVHWSVRQSVGQTVMTPFGTSLSLSLSLCRWQTFENFPLFISLLLSVWFSHDTERNRRLQCCWQKSTWNWSWW